jgi:hypothetical protein
MEKERKMEERRMKRKSKMERWMKKERKMEERWLKERNGSETQEGEEKMDDGDGGIISNKGGV